MKELHVDLGEKLKEEYVTPEIIAVSVCYEGLLCQSKGKVSVNHNDFTLDEGDPDVLWDF